MNGEALIYERFNACRDIDAVAAEQVDRHPGRISSGAR